MQGAKVGPRGPTTARIMCVGEAPGMNEERLGKPFVGASGQLLEEMLSAVGGNPQDIFFTNLCRYRPPKNELRSYFDANGFPNKLVLEGLAELKLEIEAIRPNVIIPLGNYPLALLTGRGRWKDGYTGIGDYRGSILEGSAITGGCKCVPTYHPAAILRQYPLKHIVKLDLRKAVLESGYPEIRRPVRYTIRDPRGAERGLWAEWLTSPSGTLSPPCGPEGTRYPSDPFLTNDIEYIGHQLICSGFTRHASVAVVFQTAEWTGSGFRTRKEDLEYVGAIVRSGVPLCFQNGMFDASIYSWFYDIDAFEFLEEDTMYAMHSAYIEFPKSLDFIASVFDDYYTQWKGRIDWRKVAKGEQPIEEVLDYNADDVRETHGARVAMGEDELKDPNIWRTYRHEVRLVRPLWEVSKRGVLIDTKRLSDLKTTLEKEKDTLVAGLAYLNGGRLVNPKSPPQVAKFIYDTLKVPQPKGSEFKTPGGAWKMNDGTLATLSLRCQTDTQRTGIRLVREARERLDLVSKFCNIELDDDGRMRCHYDPAKTETGRLSSRKFYPTGRGSNLQNVPRDTRVRAVFVPDKGRVFGYADLKQAESLVVSHITGDPEMLRLHSPEFEAAGGDGHAYVASKLFGKPIEAINKEERYLGKRTRHAANYGLGWFKFMQYINAEAQETGVSVTAAEAKDIIRKYRALHAHLPVWWGQIEYEVKHTHTLYTLLGRKRVFYDRPDSILPDAIAYIPQGTVGDTLNIGVLRLHPRWIKDVDAEPYRDLGIELIFPGVQEQLQHYGFEMLLQVHDAIGFQCKPEFAADTVRLLTELMSVPLQIKRRGIEPYNIVIPVDVKLGMNWGEWDPKKPEENVQGLRKWQDFLKLQEAA